MLEIRNLHVAVEGKDILKGIDLSLPEGVVHAVMGPNGAGKSTLAYVLAGRPGFTVMQGSVTYKGQDLLAMLPEARAVAGVFLGFQYPVEIPGVTTMNFLKTALNAVRKARGENELDAIEMLKILRGKAKTLGMSEDMLKRAVNVGFSGGEKKRNEILQMALLEPSLCVLDETDSGLDIDALKVVADGVNAMRASDRSMLIITHYQRLLDYIKPDRVHVLAQGRIQKSGGPGLALKLEEGGYAKIKGQSTSTEDARMSKHHAIVFDWNGTLFADTRHAWRATNHTLKLFNCKPVSFDHYRKSWAVPISELYIALGCNAQELFERQKELYDVWHQIYESRARAARLRRGARKVLKTLNEQQYDVLILSNHMIDKISLHTQRLGIHGMFSAILANDEPRRNFTNRDKSVRLKKYLEKSKARQALLVGDTIEEIEIARHHGVVSVALTHGQCTTRSLRAAKPDFLINNLNEVPAIAERVFRVKRKGRG